MIIVGTINNVQKEEKEDVEQWIEENEVADILERTFGFGISDAKI